jgi:hypothetical protein
MVLFINEDEGYLEWIRSNPDGYVLNSYCPPRQGGLKLHCATCGTITTSERNHWTDHGYCKTCSKDKDELHWWAQIIGGDLSPCRICNP